MSGSRSKHILFISLAVLAVLLAAAAANRWYAPKPTPVSDSPVPAQVGPAVFVDERQCVECHSAEQQAWTGSHHALAMQAASPATVLGDFSDRSFQQHGVRTRFLQRDGKFFVNTAGPDGRLADFEVKYTFGIDPLQQYLLELPRGRLQAFTVAWDTQRQRWFDLNSNQRVDHRDELHWSRPAYNWNFMCAECHSTGVRKNYDAAQDAYRTEFAQVNVGCQACHGPASAHLAQVRNKKGVELQATGYGQGTASASGLSQSAEVETCARCHARRSPLSSDYRHGAALMNTHLPALLQAPVYFDDGQIRDEVFEYGSFLQSRMHAKGVRCSDCHEPHSSQTRAPGNALCTSCHNETAPALRHAIDIADLERKNYDSQAHHFHEPGSPGSQCVNCHMPPRTYMLVQPRHDHSLRMPRPDLSVTLETPNACNNCHQDRTASWAAQSVAKWYGSSRRQERTYGEILAAGRNREPGAARGLERLVRDDTQAAIVRATALDVLRAYPSNASLRVFGEYLSDSDPLVRRTALLGLELLPPERRIVPVAAALKDPVRAVRIEAARLLAGSPTNQLASDDAAALRQALAEYESSQQENADRPESYMNLGNLHASRGELPAAQSAYEAALKLDAKFAPAYANLADLKSSHGALEDAADVLRAGLQAVPESAALHHSLGLVLSRQGQSQQALTELRRAMQLAPVEPRYAYVYGVALHDLQSAAAGIALLKSALQRFPNDRDLLLGLAAYARDEGDMAAVDRYLARLRSIED